MPLALKTQNDHFAFVHELKQEMHADLKYVESLEDEIDELESDKAEFSNMYDMLLQECVSNDVMCSYLHSLSDLDAYNELQCLYLHKVKECDCLAQKLSKQTEFVSKEVYTELLRSFAKLEKHSISLELALQQCQEQMKNDTVYKEKASNVFQKEREQYFKIQDLKANLQDKNIAIRVAHRTNVSRPKPRSNQIKDKVMPNTSHVKFKKIEVEGKLLGFLIVQLILFIVDSGCTKHMTGNLPLLCNFVEKYPGTVRFGNDQFTSILGYEDLVQENIMINRVYHVEGLNHNLFSVGQFCDANLEVDFQKSTCFVKDLQGNDLLTGNRGSDLYTIYLQETTSSTPIYLMAKASPTQAWLWHRKYTWTLFLHSKDETPEVLKDFLTMIQRNLQALVIYVRTDRGTEFLNKTLNAFFKQEGIEHQTSTSRTPKQNGVVERRNHTLVEAARMMLSAYKLPLDGENLDKDDNGKRGSVHLGRILYSVKGISYGREKRNFLWFPEGGGLCCTNRTDSLNPDHPEKRLPFKEEALYGLKNKLQRGPMSIMRFVRDTAKVVWKDTVLDTEYQLVICLLKSLTEVGFSILSGELNRRDLPKGIMPTKIELTLEQSHQGVSNDVLIHKDGDGDALFHLKSDSLPHAHAQTIMTYYKHQDSRIMKARELKTKTSAQTLIYKIFLQRYQVYQGRLLASFQDDAKYEHVGQDTRPQGGKDNQDGRIKI
ncbi:retrovirus-related pol polyprotein from transposon TNT 1-94 [Tanacetum coccineum]|uniref:Retrovirus-related pol polyprotein from transposon TNT 1-94 n=1 Tax=Tanacetum coccineum TaxID=301880 RepID=A0ABQ4X891_9ASTR